MVRPIARRPSLPPGLGRLGGGVDRVALSGGGDGYAATNEILHRVSPDVTFVLGLLAAKLLATLVTVGSGTPGGAFTPTLFLGAALGCSFGHLLHLAGLGQVLPTEAFALVGMGRALAATTHSPLLTIIMGFELSLNYSLIPPRMLACVISALMAKRRHPEWIYTEPLRRKGVELDRESPRLGAATEQTVADIMLAPVPPCLTPHQKLPDVLPVLLSSEARNVPVVNNLTQYRLLGAVARVEALCILSEAISARSTPKI